MIITHHREKLIGAIVYFASKTKYCGKTKLLKLLYFLDFNHFKETGKSVTGLPYSAWDRGPVPAELFSELSGKMKPDLAACIDIQPVGEFQKIVPKKKGLLNDEFFTPREKRIMSELVEIFKNIKTDDMVESTHLRKMPWDTTIRENGEKAPIDYMLAIDEDDSRSLTREQAEEIAYEMEEMIQAFGAS